MRKSFLFVILTCFLFVSFAQQNKAGVYANPKVSIAPNQSIAYPEEALLAEQEGVVIYRIFIDEKSQYKSHQLLYTSHQTLADAVGEELSQLQFVVSGHPSKSTQFVSPFIFELEKEGGQKRDVSSLMENGNACMQYGLVDMALHFYDQALDRKRKKNSDFFAVHEARKWAFLQKDKWLEARQEVTNMLAYSKELESPYSQQQNSLRTARVILDLLAGRATEAVADIHWLNRNSARNISLMSAFVKGLHLTHNEAYQLAQEAIELQESLPTKLSFWLEGVAGLALSQAHMQGQAQLKFTNLLEQESNPDFQAALLCEIGWSLYNQGKVVEALSRLQEATRLSPAMAQAHFYKALSLARLDYGAEAYESMRSAVTLGLPFEQQIHGQQMLSILAVAGRR